MNIQTILLVIAALAAVVAALAALAAWRAARGAPARLRELLAQVVGNVAAAGRADGETTRAALATAEGRLAAAIQSGTTDALERAFRQISDATRAMGEAMDTLRRQAADDAQKTAGVLEARLGLIQNSVNEKLHEAVEKQMTTSFARVLEQFAQVQQAMGEVQSAAAQIGDLKRIFSNVKTRGGWGEAQLGAMLEDILPAGAFERNVKINEGSNVIVEFAVRMPSRAPLWLAIDSKFPTEDYERLLNAVEAADPDAEKAAREKIGAQIRLEAKKIRSKYITPPTTVDFGVMYLPTDGLFLEIARIPGLIDEIGRNDRVIILGPTLLPALLRTIQLGHLTLTLEKRAEEVRGLLGVTRGEMRKMDEVLKRLANNATTMSNTIADARARTRVVDKKLKDVEIIEAAVVQDVLSLEMGALDQLPD